MVVIMQIYKKPSDMKHVIEHFDIAGNTCIYYFNKYQMFRVLETKIMNQYIIHRWKGSIFINSTVLG